MSILPTNPAELIGLVAAGGLPLSGIIVAIIAKIRSDKPTKEKPAAAETSKPTTAELSVRASLAATSEKEAHNHEVSIILEGFTASMEALRLTVQDARAESAVAKAEATSARAEAATARAEVVVLRETVDAMVDQRNELIEHIEALEALIPSPPGPPPRPTWSHKAA